MRECVQISENKRETGHPGSVRALLRALPKACSRFSFPKELCVLDALCLYTFDTVDADTEDDSDDADSDSGEPARLIFLRLRGRPFNFGAEINTRTLNN